MGPSSMGQISESVVEACNPELNVFQWLNTLGYLMLAVEGCVITSRVGSHGDS